MPLDATGACREFIRGSEYGKRVAYAVLTGMPPPTCDWQKIPAAQELREKFLQGMRNGIEWEMQEARLSRDCPTCGGQRTVGKVSKSGFHVETWPCPNCRAADYDAKKAES